MTNCLNDSNRDYRLDMLRAISISLVLLWHLQPFRFEKMPGSTIGIVLQYALDIFNSQVSLVAVPVFVLVSLYLFYSKALKNLSYFRVRLLRIFDVMIFWYSIQFLVFYGTVDYFYDITPKFSYLKSLMFGGPSLPLVAGSVFYFLFVILVLTVAGFAYCNIKNSRIRMLLAFLVIIISLLYFEICSIFKLRLPYWRIDSFIIYIPTAFLLAKYSEKFMRFKYFFLIVFILSSIQDIFLKESKPFLNIYGRISVFAGSLTLFCFCYSINFHKKWFPNILSNYSLGIFALHKYFFLLFIILINKLFIKFKIIDNIYLANCKISLFYFVVGIITISVTLISAYVLGLTPLKRYVF